MKRLLLPLTALGLALGGAACSLPHGSFARPVSPAGAGSSLISAGALVPFAAVGGVNADDGDSSFASATSDRVLVVPSVGYDYALNDRHYLGFDVSVWSSGLVLNSDAGDELLAVFINPRWEYAATESLSLTVDGNLAYLRVDNGDGDVGQTPFVSPTFGMRYYLDTGFGGLIFSQQVGTAFITLALPGSLAYDVPIPLGDTTVLHLFPEIRWDPTFFFVGDVSGGVALFSGGMTFMLEI
jgi:hypothetical protein